MSYKRRLKDIEEALSVNEEKLKPLVVVIDKGTEKGKPCPLEIEEIESRLRKVERIVLERKTYA